MRIRQIAFVAADLGRALADLGEVLALGAPFEDPGVGVFGLRNGVFPVGDQFLEVVSPKQENTSAGRYLERRGGDGGYMVIFQTPDLAKLKSHLAAEQVRTVWEIALPDIETAHLHPRDTGGAIVSVDESRPAAEWRWAGPKWREEVRTDRVSGIAGVEIQSEDPEALAERWSRIFEIPRTTERCELRDEDGGRIRFAEAKDGRGEGIRSLYLKCEKSGALREAALARGLALDGDAAVVCGVRLVEA